MECAGIRSGVQLQIKGYNLVSDFYQLELDDLDVVLGGTWLGPMVLDFSALTMSLQGSVVPNSQVTSSKRSLNQFICQGKFM